MAYQSNETGRYEVYVRPFPGRGGPIPISTAGGVYPRWSRDGKELYFIAPDAKLMAVPIRATTTMLEAGAPAALFQTRRLGGGSNVIGRSHQYDVARDGRFLINVDAQVSAPPITLLMNWNPIVISSRGLPRRNSPEGEEGVMAQICPRWNPLTSWIRQIKELQRAA